MLTASRPLPTASTSPFVSTSLTQRSFTFPRIKVAATSLLRHENRFAELRQLNSQRAACQLPAHVLRHIFEICASTTVGCPDSELTLSSPSRGRLNAIGVGMLTWSWVMISYVCHAWRKIALEHSELWRFVDFSHPRWATITLSRAKMQPLCIQAVVGRHNLQRLHRTLQLAHRIASIQLDSSLHHIHGLLDTLAHPNPTLESLTVRVNTGGHGIQDQVYPLPAYPLVGPSLPCMKYLELHSAPFYLVSGRYVSLTDLRVYDLTPCERPTLQQFLGAISKFPDLERLTLDNAFPLTSNSIPFPHSYSYSPESSPSSSPPHAYRSPPSPFYESRVGLPHLTTLHLSGSIEEVAIVLENLMLPPDAQITCVINNLSDWQESMPRLAEALSVHSWAAVSGGHPLETLIISGIEEDAYPPAMAGLVYGGVHNGVAPLTAKGARIRGFSSPKDPFFSISRSKSPFGGNGSSSPRNLTPSFDLIIGPDADPDFSSDEIIISALTSVWNALALANVDKLVLHDLDIVTQKTWTQFLKNLPSLRVLDITGHAPSGFVWALLLNAVACIQREERERERREKREKKALKAVLHKAGERVFHGTFSPTSSPPMSPLPPTSPLNPTPSSSRKLFVSKLTDIYLHGVDCSSGGYMVAQAVPVNSHWDLDDSRFLDVFLACLQMRSQAVAAARFAAPPSLPPSPLGNSSYSLGRPGTPQAPPSGLRSVTISNCRSVPRQPAFLLKEFVAHSVWDQRGILKETEDTGLANYRKPGEEGALNTWNESCREEPRHYYRLKTLLDELDF